MFRPSSDIESLSRRLKRNNIVFGLFIAAWFVLLIIRLLHLQVLEHTSLFKKSENNRIRVVELDGLRGSIFDRNGTIMVENIPSFEVVLTPEDTQNLEKTLDLLAKKIDINKELLMKNISKKNEFSKIVVAENITRDQMAFVVENRYNLAGVDIYVRPIRKYTKGVTAAHLIGYMGLVTQNWLDKDKFGYYSKDDLVGVSGIEKGLEPYLRSVKGLKKIEINSVGRELSIIDIINPKSGNDLYLTIDYETQLAAEQAFDEENRIGAAVAIDPNNGDILAYISRPVFDPNLFSHGISKDSWDKVVSAPLNVMQNRAMNSQYPPGSTIKPFIAYAALKENIITTDKQIFCPGYLRYGNKTFRCWKKEGHGYVNLHRAIVESCDVFFYTLGIKLGVDKIAEYQKMFGFGSIINLPIGNSKPGLIPTSEWKLKNRHEKWIPGETLPVSIGQGYTLVTPLHMALATAMIANGGKFIEPVVVKEIVSQSYGKRFTKHETINKNTNFDNNFMTFIKEAMKDTVYDKNGTAWRLRTGDKTSYLYAAKTGTAQVVKMKQTKQDIEDIKFKFRDHSWFIAFAPYNDPEIAVAVIAEHSGSGGDVSARIAKQIIDKYLKKDDTVQAFKDSSKQKNKQDETQ